MKLSDVGPALAVTGTASTGSATSSFLKMMGVISDNQAAIGILVSVFFGLIGLVFMYLNYREVRKTRILNSQAEKNAVEIKKIKAELKLKSKE